MKGFYMKARTLIEIEPTKVYRTSESLAMYCYICAPV